MSDVAGVNAARSDPLTRGSDALAVRTVPFDSVIQPLLWLLLLLLLPFVVVALFFVRFSVCFFVLLIFVLFVFVIVFALVLAFVVVAALGFFLSWGSFGYKLNPGGPNAKKMTLTQRSKTEVGQKFMTLLKPLSDLVAAYLRKHNSALAHIQELLPLQHRPFGVYHYVTLHLSPTFKEHQDKLDFKGGMTAVVPFGSFTGGAISLPEYNITITQKVPSCSSSPTNATR